MVRVILSLRLSLSYLTADKGAAALAGREKMIAALENLKSNFEPMDRRAASLDTLKISGRSAFLALFSTHPSLEKRIEALKNPH